MENRGVDRRTTDKSFIYSSNQHKTGASHISFKTYYIQKRCLVKKLLRYTREYLLTKVGFLATKVRFLATKVRFLATKVRFLAMKVRFLATKVCFLATKVGFLAMKVCFSTHESRFFVRFSRNVLGG
jgi:hypothetical protein